MNYPSNISRYKTLTNKENQNKMAVGKNNTDPQPTQCVSHIAKGTEK